MKRNRTMFIAFLAPAIISYLIVFIYPTVRTLLMSFFHVDNITAKMSTWTFTGMQNYFSIFESEIFVRSFLNILKIWAFGGIGIFVVAMLFAVLLTSGIKMKSFYRSIIYLPNVISAVAMGTMWMQYVYSSKFGLLKTVFSFFGAEKLAAIQWTGPELLFGSMLVAFSFGMIGYFMLIFMAGIDRIPVELNEAAKIDGADGVRRFFRVTLPLLKGVIRTNLVLWTIEAVGFFVWSQVFSPRTLETATITPMVYMYQLLFGSETVVTARNVGGAAAVGVLMTVIVIVMFVASTKLLKDDGLEF